MRQKIRAASLVLLAAAALPGPSAFALSLKNFREVNAFFANATGISPTQNDIKSAYAGAKARLPLRGQVSEFSSPAVLASIELGGAYCLALINKDKNTAAANRRAHRAIDFTKKPADLKDEDLKSTVEIYANMFWERDLSADEEAAFQSAFTNLKKSSPATAAGTSQLLTVLCNQVATSLEALIYQ